MGGERGMTERDLPCHRGTWVEDTSSSLGMMIIIIIIVLLPYADIVTSVKTI